MFIFSNENKNITYDVLIILKEGCMNTETEAHKQLELCENLFYYDILRKTQRKML